jgi:drug/metabolite transporter (DMT)-like permease
LFGASAPFAKVLLRDQPPQLLAGVLYGGAGLGLAVIALLNRKAATESRLTRTGAPWLFGAIAFGGVVGPVLLMIGLAETPASTSSLLLNLEGVFTASLAWVVFRENVDRRIAVGMAAIVAGGLVLSWGNRAELSSWSGPLAISGACLCWAIDNNLTQKVSGSDPVVTATLKGLIAGVVNIGIAVALGATLPRASIALAAATLGFASYGASLAFYILALRYLGTARTGAYFSLAPFVGAALAILGWHEPVTVFFAIGAACMAFGVWLHLTERHSHLHEHEPFDHDHAHIHDEHHLHDHTLDDPPVTDPVPHAHRHRHARLVHAHQHYPDLHHRHTHN